MKHKTILQLEGEFNKVIERMDLETMQFESSRDYGRHMDVNYELHRVLTNGEVGVLRKLIAKYYAPVTRIYRPQSRFSGCSRFAHYRQVVFIFEEAQ